MADLTYTYVIRSEYAQRTNPDPALAQSDYWVFVPRLIPGGDNNERFKMCVKSVTMATADMTDPIIECFIDTNGSQCSVDVKNGGPTSSAAVMSIVSPTDNTYTLIGAPSRVVNAPNFCTLHVQWRNVKLDAQGDDDLCVGEDVNEDPVPIPYHIIVLEFTPLK